MAIMGSWCTTERFCRQQVVFAPCLLHHCQTTPGLQYIHCIDCIWQTTICQTRTCPSFIVWRKAFEGQSDIFLSKDKTNINIISFCTLKKAKMWPGVEDHHNVAENEKCYVNLSRLEQRVDRPRERCHQFKSEISFPSHSASSTFSLFSQHCYQLLAVST